MANFAIRAEGPGDAERIAATHRAAFGGDLEAKLVDRLRAEGELLVSLVCEMNSTIVGHIAIAPAGIAGAPGVRLAWLAPVGVRPDRQLQGIGTELVRAALDRARALCLAGVIVLGDPVYYRRFGFDSSAAAKLGSRFAGPALQLQPFTPDALSGELIEPRAFGIFS